MLGEVSIILLFALSCFLIWANIKGRKMQVHDSNSYGKENSFLMRAVYFILYKAKNWSRFGISNDRMERLKKIYTGKNQEEIYYLYFGKMGIFLLYIAIAGLFLIMLSGFVIPKGKLIKGYFLERDSEMGKEHIIDLTAEADGKAKDIKIRVPASMYTDEEQKKKFKEAKDYIARRFLGDNTSDNRVIKPLYLMTSVPESAVKISWRSENPNIVQADGNVNNEELEDELQVGLIATISYAKVKEEVSKMITVQPPQKSREEIFWERWNWELEKNEEASRQQEYMSLPKNVDGHRVTYQEEKQQTQSIIFVCMLAMLVLIPTCMESQLKRELISRERELKMDYPDFVEHFVLLIGAGLNVKGAWQRIVKEYENRDKNEKKHFVYEEMLMSVREMENGMSEAKAYELFGKRTGLLPYMKFCTLIVQNLKKGSADLVKLLDYEVVDAFHERRENAKALGEEAATKLILPMMLMLSIVFALIMYAAFQSM